VEAKVLELVLDPAPAVLVLAAALELASAVPEVAPAMPGPHRVMWPVRKANARGHKTCL